MKQDNITFRKEWMASVEAVPTEKGRAELALAILRYAFNGTAYTGNNIFVNAVTPAVFAAIDATKQRSANGKRNGKMGGNPLLAAKRVNPTLNPEDNPKVNPNNSNSNDDVNDDDDNTSIVKVEKDDKGTISTIAVVEKEKEEEKEETCALQRQDGTPISHFYGDKDTEECIAYLKAQASAPTEWRESVMRRHRMAQDTLMRMIDEFADSTRARGQNMHNASTIKAHFDSWLTAVERSAKEGIQGKESLLRRQMKEGADIVAYLTGKYMAANSNNGQQ